MSKGKVYISNYPDNPPEWYWISGLHDACIIGTESFEFPFDYNFLSRLPSEKRLAKDIKIPPDGLLGCRADFYCKTVINRRQMFFDAVLQRQNTCLPWAESGCYYICGNLLLCRQKLCKTEIYSAFSVNTLQIPPSRLLCRRSV